MKKQLALLLALVMVLSLFGCGVSGEIAGTTEGTDSGFRETLGLPTEPDDQELLQTEPTQTTEALLDEYGWYYSAEDVALYLVTYGQLPDNFITKKEARELGWEGGSVERYAPGCAIGGDRFGNYEGLLPEEYDYIECDIDTDGGKSRGAKRLVFAYDGPIYYTEDHYESFELLYEGDWE